MAIDVSELCERMKDSTSTFTTEEVQALLDWKIDHALKTDFQRQRIAAEIARGDVMMQSALDMLEYMTHSIDFGNVAPTLQVISYEQA